MIEKEDSKIIPELLDELEQERHAPDLFTKNKRTGNNWKMIRRFILLLFIIVLCFMIIKIDFPITGTAHVIPSQLLPVEALESGIIETINVKSGEKVVSGEEIASLNNYQLINEMQESKLKMEMVRKKLLQLDRNRNYLRIVVNNHEELYRDEIIARSELEKVKLDYTQALQEYQINQDEMQTLRSKINYLQEAIKNLRIIAPISGIVLTKIENKLGTFVRKGDEICQIGSMENFLMELPINEKYIDRIAIGEDATIRFSAFAHKPVRGKVIKVQHTAWEKLKKVLVKERVINVYIKPQHVSMPVKPGMTANIKIHSGRIYLRWMKASGKEI